MLRVVTHENAAQFLDRAEPWLLEREAEANVLLSVAYLLLSGTKPFVEPSYLATIESRDRVVGCAMQPPPDGVHLTEIPAAAVAVVAAQLREAGRPIAEVTGPEPAAVEFARCFSAAAWVLHSRLRRYRLEAVTPPERKPCGVLRLGNAGDCALLDEWALAYGREVGSNVDTAAFFSTMVERQALYLWDDDGPRCVVTASGLTRNGARISGAYTPPVDEIALIHFTQDAV